MELWELSAREQIRDLIARYTHCADSGRFRDLVMLFSEEGELEVESRPPLRGRLAIEAFLEGVGTTLAERHGRPIVRHLVTNVLLDVQDPDSATAASYFVVLNASGLDHWGRYRDRFIRLGEQWFFASRSVRLDHR